jgi:large subunit ribosomal protein L1
MSTVDELPHPAGTRSDTSHILYTHTFQASTSTRLFHAAAVLGARSKQPATKAQRAATAQKKKSWYDSEKLSLLEAINVLRVSKYLVFAVFNHLTLHLQAVEVTSPNATYELTIKTAMGKGITIPKGRFSLPREAKSQSEDRILVFAEGQAAEDAKAAGADVVGGPELIDGVRASYNKLNAPAIC